MATLVRLSPADIPEQLSVRGSPLFYPRPFRLSGETSELMYHKTSPNSYVIPVTHHVGSVTGHTPRWFCESRDKKTGHGYHGPYGPKGVIA